MGNGFHHHHITALAKNPQLGGGSVGKIYDTPAQERPPVVHPYDNAAAALLMSDPGVAGQGQGGVRGRHSVHVVGFAVGGFLAMKLTAIPGCHAPLL